MCVNRALLLLVLGGFVACGKTTATRGDKFPEEEAACAIPAHPPDVVLAVTRHVIPIGEIRMEAGEITATGRCSPKTDCVHVEHKTMDQLVALVRGMGRIRHRQAQVSPHYGFRGITARWAGGECSFSDGVVTPIDERDEKKFYAVYAAIVDAITKSSEHLEPN